MDLTDYSAYYDAQTAVLGSLLIEPEKLAGQIMHMVRPEDFQIQDSGAVLLTEEGRRKFLKAWQERKRDTLTHPYLNEKMSWGMIPYVQALLLARFLRGDLDGYPPFLWK